MRIIKIRKLGTINKSLKTSFFWNQLIYNYNNHSLLFFSITVVQFLRVHTRKFYLEIWNVLKKIKQVNESLLTTLTNQKLLAINYLLLLYIIKNKCPKKFQFNYSSKKSIMVSQHTQITRWQTNKRNNDKLL